MTHQTTIRVRYQETDQMGVVYHSNYFVWFEIGRTEFFRDLGLEYKLMEEEEILVPAVDVRCAYKSPAKYDDEILISTTLVELKSVKVRFDYKVERKSDKRLLATGYTVHAFTSKDLKILNFKKTNKAIFDRLYMAMEK